MNDNNKYLMNKSRLEALIDGIFAIVMTLLIMTVVVPQRETVISNLGFHGLLHSRIHDIFNYSLSFALLALFWIRHHEQSQFIRKTNHIHIFINMLMLFFIAIFPFSTSLISEFPDEDLAEIVFGSNMVIVGFLYLINWTYVTRKRRLVDDTLDHSDIVTIRNKSLVFLLFSVILIILSQMCTGITADVFWIIPALLFSDYLFRKKK